MSIEFNTGDNDKSMSDILRDALAAKNTSQRKFAEMMGWSPQNFNQRLKKNSFTAEEWNKMLKMLGYEMKIVELESGVEFECRREGHGRRVQQVINGVLYDTYKADAICSNFYTDGSEYTDGMAFELYVDSYGRFFLARYVEWEDGKDSITTVTKEYAKELYLKYGDGTLPDTMFI